jgi:chromosome segregation ATPase
MITINLTPSDKKSNFRKITDDLANNMEEVLGAKPYEFLIDELERLSDLYDDVGIQKAYSDLQLERAEEKIEKLENKVEYLEKEIEDLNEEVENLNNELESKE